ncbi:hypothetical protein SDC9_181158 [bioreactor metagenome]|uniref:Uncharacterized protein n=1 Tax=bioreactor metagenome TaxID=1076179 RepID=A0A645H3U2_9ZZZZ
MPNWHGASDRRHRGSGPKGCSPVTACCSPCVLGRKPSSWHWGSCSPAESWSSPIREQARRSSARVRDWPPRAGWRPNRCSIWPPARHCADSPGGADWSSRRMPGSYRRPAIFGRAAGCPVHLAAPCPCHDWPGTGMNLTVGRFRSTWTTRP